MSDLAAGISPTGWDPATIAEGHYCHDACADVGTMPKSSGPVSDSPSLVALWAQTRTGKAIEPRIVHSGVCSRGKTRRIARRSAHRSPLARAPVPGGVPHLNDRERGDLARRINAVLATTRSRHAGTEIGVIGRVSPSSLRTAFDKVASNGDPPASSFKVGTHNICIGDVDIDVPKTWYEAGSYWDELTSEDEALAWIWPLQMARLASDGLTDEEINGLWACVDIEPTPGAFWTTVDDRGIGGYAGRAFYWISQYAKMFWEFTEPGRTVGGYTTPCGGGGGDGLSNHAHRLFQMGDEGVRWHVWATRRRGTSSLHFQPKFSYYPDWLCANVDSSDKPVDPGTKVEASCYATALSGPDYASGFAFVVNGVVQELNSSDDYEIVERGGACVSYVDTALKSDKTNHDPGANAYVTHTPCSVDLRAGLIGQVGLKADYYLHYAHVVAAYGVKLLGEGSFDDLVLALPYFYAALLLGKYAASEITNGTGDLVHELGHIYLVPTRKPNSRASPNSFSRSPLDFVSPRVSVNRESPALFLD